uniref:Uncharacterized protein n=1 Tax=Araucaria cunninghamii TaxID=56994 RepID=A0A0D6QY45_ARACU
MSTEVTETDPSLRHYVDPEKPDETASTNTAYDMAVMSDPVGIGNKNNDNSVIDGREMKVFPPSTRLWKQQSWSSDSSREEAWIRRREQFRLKRRSKSLTDEDLDELRGCIDLGFRFGYDEEDHSLCNTFPALDFYYAVNRQYNDCKVKSSSPSSTPDQCGYNRSFPPPSCDDSPGSHHSDTWRISSPGIHFSFFSSSFISRGTISALA